MVTTKADPIEGKSASSAGELEQYEDVQGDAKLEEWFRGDGNEEWGDQCEVGKVWRGGLDPSCE